MKFQTKSNGVFDIRIAPDQSRFACALIGSPLKVYALPSGAELLSINDSNYDSVWSVDWKALGNGQYLFAGYGENGYLRIFDGNGKSVIQSKHRSDGGKDAAQIHSNSVDCLRVIGETLVSVSSDRCINLLSLANLIEGSKFVYDRKQEQRLQYILPLHRCCRLSSTLIAITTDADEIIVLDRTKTDRITVIPGKDEKFSGIARRSDNELITVSWSGKMKFWDLSTESVLQEIALEGPSRQVSVIGNQIVHTAGEKIVFRDAVSLEIQSELRVHDQNVRCFDLTNDGKWIVSGDDGGLVAITPINPHAA
jgi:WD40 repeat protein